MEARFLLDTNTASYIIKGSSPRLEQRLVRMPPAQLAISAVTEGELRFGIARQPKATRLHTLVEEFLVRITILPWDSNCARVYGELCAYLETQGQSIGNLDLMIAAHALAVPLILVTHDQAFGRIRQLKVADWTQ